MSYPGPRPDLLFTAGDRSDNNTLPESLRRVLEDPTHPHFNKFPYDVALAMEPGVYGMCWQTKNDEEYYEGDYLGLHYAKLSTFMSGMSANTVFGPHRSYFSTSKSGLSWQNLPPALETHIMDRIKLGRPSVVALGMRGAYVVLYDDSTLAHDLQGLYPALQPLMDSADERSKRSSITCVALSPYVAGHYFVAFGNGTAQWNLPAEMEADVLSVCASLRPLPAAAAASGQPDTVLGATLNFQLAQSTGMALNSLFRPGW
ncbi:hypothetical protein DFH09DRAFT_1194019 [Mycena vulgaris]|nr:hypothetical protein DFH09DRAFT_1194019 [Mycena vulgaris]